MKNGISAKESFCVQKTIQYSQQTHTHTHSDAHSKTQSNAHRQTVFSSPGRKRERERDMYENLCFFKKQIFI